ncbi:MAG TPA: MFS transporter [Candidatus Aminicenantes bacterium]|mgnify:CR=1 FL=1|nr:MFS transporter [Candidatus Aminicenantes bacterium]
MATPESALAPAAERSLRRTALAMSMVSSFLTPFMASSMNLAMPLIGREFGLSAVRLSWVLTAYTLAAAMFLVPLGRLADLRGRKRVFSLGLGLDIAGAALGALAPSAPLLILARGIQGLGGAMIFGTGYAILTSVYPPRERGHAIGLNTAAVYTGLSLGPVLGGFIVHAAGWRAVFLSTIPIAALGLGLALFRLEGEWAEARGESFDVPGSIAYGLGLVALMYGFSRLPSPAGAALTLAGVLVLTGFVVLEGRVPAPLFDLRLFRRSRIFAFSNLAAFLNYSATAGVSFLLSLYLQSLKGLPPQKAGLVLISQPVVMAATSPLAGRLSDRVEPRILASLGMALSAAGLFLFSFLGAGTGLGAISAGLVLLGFGFGFFASPNTNAIMGSVGNRHLGVASAALGTMRLTGQMMSAGMVMMIFALVMGRSPIEPSAYPLFVRSARIAFAFFAVICVVGVFASLARGDRVPNGDG